MFEAAFTLLDGLEGEAGGDSGEDIELPREVFPVRSGRHFKLDQVAHRRGDESEVVFKVLSVTRLSFLFKFTKSFGKGFGEVRGDGGLLGDDKSL